MKRSEIEKFLPGIVQTTLPPGESENLLTMFLGLMELLHEPSEAIMEQLDIYFDPYRTPFPIYLSSWLSLETLWIDRPQDFVDRPFPEFPTGEGRLRELIAGVIDISKWRGTRRGMLLYLETATGIRGYDIDETVTGPDGRVIPFHIKVTMPPRAIAYRALVERIVVSEKPAYVTYELHPKPRKGARS